MDINGENKMYNPVSVKPAFINSGVKIYTNSATNTFYINAKSNSKIIITSIDGKVMKTLNTLNNTTQIEASNWANGVYIIQIQSSPKLLIKKIIITK